MVRDHNSTNRIGAGDRQRAFEVAKAADLDRLHRQLQRLSGPLHDAHYVGVRRTVVHEEDARPGHRRRCLLEKRQTLRHKLGIEEGQSGHVAAGMGEAVDDAGGDDIAGCCHDDRNRPRRAPGGEHSGPVGHDEIDLELDQLGCEAREPRFIFLGRAEFDTEVFALDIPEIAQRLQKSGRTDGGHETEITDQGDALLALRSRRERPCRSAADKAEERAPSHSITLSALASRSGGTSMPSALAVLRLTTSSNLVGCMTGRSAGFSPLRMRPV